MVSPDEIRNQVPVDSTGEGGSGGAEHCLVSITYPASWGCEDLSPFLGQGTQDPLKNVGTKNPGILKTQLFCIVMCRNQSKLPFSNESLHHLEMVFRNNLKAGASSPFVSL